MSNAHFRLERYTQQRMGINVLYTITFKNAAIQGIVKISSQMSKPNAKMHTSQSCITAAELFRSPFMSCVS